MSTLQVTIPVPTSGDGPFVDVSALVGPKTIQLTGYFSGYYDLLASQDDAEFVAVAAFAAGGLATIVQTVSGSFKSFRLRANAQPSTPISCTASAEEGVGQNHFTPLALGVAVDTWALFPPTGVEEDVCFVCRGAFRGSVVVSGSPDDVAWNPLGSFRADRLPEGSPVVLAFSPLPTLDKVRYVRADLAGTATGPVVVTMGGRIPAGGGATGTKVSILASPVLGNQFYLGTAATSSPIVDDRGNTVTPGGSSRDDVVCLGQSNTVSFNANNGPLVVVGADNTINGASSVVAGSDQTTGTDAFSCVLVGSFHNTLGDRSAYDIVVGNLITVGTDTFFCQARGLGVVIQTGSGIVEASGYIVNVGASCVEVIALGSQLTVGDSSSDVVNIGKSVAIGQRTSNVVALGTNLTTPDDTSNMVSVGTSLSAASGDTYCSMVGSNSSIGADSFFCQVRGLGVTLSHNCGIVEASGYLVTIADTCQEVVALGSQLSLGASSSVIVNIGKLNTVGAGTVESLVVGGNNTLAAGANRAVVSGYHVTVLSGDPGHAAAFCVASGSQITVDVFSQDTVASGHNIGVGKRTVDVVALGDSVTVDDDCQRVVSIGTNLVNRSGDSRRTTDIVQIGQDITIDGIAPGLVAIGTSIANTQDWTAGSNNRDHASVVIGFCGGLNANAVFTRAILIGVPTVGAGGDLSLVTSIGDSVISHGTTNGKLVVVGYTNQASGQSSSVYGSDNTIQDGSLSVNVVGNSNVVNSGTVESLVVGSNNTLATGADRAVVTGYHITVSSGDPGHAAAFCVASGSLIQVGILSQETVAVGHTVTVGERTLDVVAVGDGLTVTDDCQYITVLGSNSQVGKTGDPGISYIVSIGASNDLTLCAGTSNVVGSNNVFQANCQGHVLGNANTFQVDPEEDFNTYGIAIGTGCTILSTGQIWAIAIGYHATAGDGQCIIGDSDNTVDPKPQIHYFAVRGYNGLALDTIRAVDDPADGESGLAVVYNAGGTFSQKMLKASASPPVGALLAYLE